jgi:hypothetical protein
MKKVIDIDCVCDFVTQAFLELWKRHCLPVHVLRIPFYLRVVSCDNYWQNVVRNSLHRTGTILKTPLLLFGKILAVNRVHSKIV